MTEILGAALVSFAVGFAAGYYRRRGKKTTIILDRTRRPDV